MEPQLWFVLSSIESASGERTVHHIGLSTEATAAGLKPFSLYTFILEACSTGGCSSTRPLSLRTAPAPPSHQPPPRVDVTGPHAMRLTWEPPEKPNGTAPEFVSPPKVSAMSSSSLRVSWNSTEGHGVIARGTVTEYRVNMVTEQSNNPNAPPVFSQVLHQTNSSAETTHVVEGLRPYQVSRLMVFKHRDKAFIYKYLLEYRAFCLLRPVNDTVVHVEWSPPAQLNGPPPIYQVERTDVSLSDPYEPVTRGTRFPGSSYYRFPGQTLPVNTDYTGIQLSFRSRAADGLLLCAFSPGGQEEFLALQIQNGRPYFLFDPQDSAVAVGVQDDGHRRYDDGEWHSVMATRHGAVGTIIVDHQYQGRAGASSLSSIIGENTGLYVGGLPADFTVIRQHLGDTQMVRKGFSGCLRDVKLKHTAGPSGEWKALDWSTAVEKVAAYESWEGCPVDSEDGVHFLGHGYLELDGSIFSGGRNFDITMEFRTDQLNAILVFTYSNDMWVGLSYCDGDWNQLSLAKRGNVISAAISDWEEQMTGGGGGEGAGCVSIRLGGCLRKMTVQSDGAPQRRVVHTVNLSAASRYSVRVHMDGCSPGHSRFLCRRERLSVGVQRLGDARSGLPCAAFHRGLIDRYELRAYQRDDPDAAPVVEAIHLTDGNHTGLLSGLTPATRYVAHGFNLVRRFSLLKRADIKKIRNPRGPTILRLGKASLLQPTEGLRMSDEH
ncbi:hypothetical protein CRUP_020339 [Coryphaenoides rupestris]|nr:hypothetical protein CRUP_020339 [Coryphaenoides rupestris]